MAKKNNNLLIIGVVLLAFIIFTSDGTLPFSIGGGAGGIPAPGQAPNNPGFTNILSLSDYDICRGDSLTVTVQTNIPNGECAAFVNPHNSGWQYLSSINLNANGQYSASQTINAPADNYLAGVVCGDDSGNYKVSNLVNLVVRECEDSPVPDGSQDIPVACGWHNATIYSLGTCGGTCPVGQTCQVSGSVCMCFSPQPEQPVAGNIFVSSIQWNGALGGAYGVDAKCSNMAFYAGLSGVWVSIISNNGTDIRDRFMDQAYYRMDGVKVANSKADLLDGSILAAINLDENGILRTGDNSVWTGSYSNGYSSGVNCQNWNWVDSMGSIGNMASLSTWLGDGDADQHCYDYNRIYCVKIADGYLPT